MYGNGPSLRNRKHQTGSALFQDTSPVATSPLIKSVRFIPKDIHDYAEKTLLISSLIVEESSDSGLPQKETLHTQPMTRGIEFLDDRRKKDIQQKKLIVVDPEAATRYATHHNRCDGESSLLLQKA